MNRISPHTTPEDRFCDYREIPASELFTRASQLEEGNFDARQLAQKLACVAVEEEDRR
jgi:hypothetical protein